MTEPATQTPAKTNNPQTPGASGAVQAESVESLEQLWKRAESMADAEGDDDEGASDEPSKPAPKPAAKPAKAKVETEDDATEAEDGADGAVTPGERVKWRERKRKEREQLARERADFESRANEVIQQVRERGQVIETFARALESGDWDAAAKAVGRESWNALNKEVIERHQNPAYKRVLELERRDREREENARRQNEEREVRERQAKQQQARDQYLSELGKTLTEHDDERVSALAQEDPDFVRYLFSLHVAQARRAGEVDEQGALDDALAYVEKKYQTLHKIFGGQAASQPELPARDGQAPAKSARKRPTTVSRSKAVDAGPPREMTDAEWRAHFSRELAKADGIYPTT